MLRLETVDDYTTGIISREIYFFGAFLILACVNPRGRSQEGRVAVLCHEEKPQGLPK